MKQHLVLIATAWIVSLYATVPVLGDVTTENVTASNTFKQLSANATNYFLGKVGIGTNKPGAQLHVTGEMKVDGAMTLPRQGDVEMGAYTNGASAAGASPGYLPTGMMNPYAGTTAPAGWLMCDGSAVSRTTYSALFVIISTNYGNGDGSTTFNLPDMRQRFPLGKAASGTGSILGSTGGAIDHYHATTNHTLTTAELASHSHGAGTYAANGGGSIIISSPVDYGTDYGADEYPMPISGTHTHTISGTSGTAGTNTPHAHGNTATNNPPFLTINYIIKI
ncbi:MAG: tail fiber protein [bacterium]